MCLCKVTQLVTVINEQNALSLAPMISTYPTERFNNLYKKIKNKIKKYIYIY